MSEMSLLSYDYKTLAEKYRNVRNEFVILYLTVTFQVMTIELW
jgi:hypothetical protein